MTVLTLSRWNCINIWVNSSLIQIFHDQWHHCCRKPANTPVGSCEVPGLEQYYSPHPDQYPDLINIQYHHGHGQQEDMSPPPPPPDWQTNHPQHHHQDPYSGGANEVKEFLWNILLLQLFTDHLDAPLAIQSNLQHERSSGTGNRSPNNFTATEAGQHEQTEWRRRTKNTAKTNHQELFQCDHGEQCPL